MVVTFMVGPPCSGKSTVAKEMASKDRTLVRVNRDEMRQMLKGMYISGDPDIEFIVNCLTEQAIMCAHALNMNVIIDATHCKEKYINEVKAMLPSSMGVQYKYILCEQPLRKLRWRNFWRYYATGIRIPDKVLRSMSHNFKHVKAKIKAGDI